MVDTVNMYENVKQNLVEVHNKYLLEVQRQCMLLSSTVADHSVFVEG